MNSGCLPTNDRGVALLLALTAISFLTVMTIMLLNDVDRQAEDAAQLRQSVLLDAAVESGLSVVQAALLADGKANKHDCLHDPWADIEAEGVSNQLIDATLSIQVEDLSGRLQINALVEQDKGEVVVEGEESEEGESVSELQAQLWKRLLLSGKFAVKDEQQVDELLDALRDWLDADDETRTYGAESSYYQSVSPGYKSRNGRVSITDDLLLVKGMTPDLFYGDDEHEGLGKYITAVGTDGKVNINTASSSVLLALAPGLEEEMVEEMIAYRQESDNMEKLADAGWYKGVPGVPADVTFDEAAIAVVAQGFGVNITARSGKMVKKARGVITRGKKNEQALVQWQVR